MEEARAMVLLLGSKRFGAPDPASQGILEAITPPEALERLADGLLEAESWQELLA